MKIKKIIILSIMSGIILSFSITALAASTRYDNCAKALNTLGLFNGIGTDFDGEIDYALESNTTRAEALVMFIRILGEETDAKQYNGVQPFSDVEKENWAYSYVAYAYSKGYTLGTGESSFSPNEAISINAYITFLLRALEYSDNAGDFKYSAALQKAEQIGMLTSGMYSDGNDICLRDDCAYISLSALRTLFKDSEEALADRLIGKNIFSKQQWEKNQSEIAIAEENFKNSQKSTNRIAINGKSSVYEYDEYNRPVRSLTYHAIGNPFAVGIDDYEYNENGMLSGILELSLFNRHDNGVFDFVEYSKISYASDGISKTVSHYTGEPFNAEASAYGANEFIGEDRYEYNSTDSTLSVHLATSQNPVIFDYLDPKIQKVVVYDESGKLHRTIEWSEDRSIRTEYDGMTSSQLSRIETNDAGLLAKVTYMKNGQFETNEEFFYNSDRRLTKAIWRNKYEEAVYNYRYYSNGRLERIIMTDNSGTACASIDYDNNGDLKR